MSRPTTSLLCYILTGLCVLIAGCGCPDPKPPATPFHHASQPNKDRDWPLDTEADTEGDGFVFDSDEESDAEEDDDDDSSSEDDDSYEDEVEDSDVGDLDLGDDDFEDEDFEGDE